MAFAACPTVSARLALDIGGQRKGFTLLVAMVVVLIVILSYLVDLGDLYPSSAKTLDVQSHDKWIIVDVNSPHCKGQGRFQVPQGWRVLMAGESTQSKSDRSSPSGSTATQDTGEDSKRPLLRNEAYLTAIMRGARQILETDCSMSAAEVLAILHVHDKTHHGLLYNDTRLFNPYAHFGAWASIPRAFSDGTPINNSRTYYVRDFDRVLVKHVVRENSVDAVTINPGTGASTQGLGVKFDSSAPPVFLGQGSFAAAVPGSSLYQHQAFWTLLLPCVTPTLPCHVLRLFVQQRLLREMDAFSAYYQFNAFVPSSSLPGFRGFHSGCGVDLLKLATLLDAWNCSANVTFYDCFRDLAELLHKADYLTQEDNTHLKTWIEALQTSGVAEPARVASPWRGVRRRGEVKVTLGSLRARLESSGSDGVHALWQQSVEPVKQRCNISDAGWLPSASQWKTPVIDDVVLIVVFNQNQYVWPNMAFMETLHRPFFKHIVYCVSDVDPLSQDTNYKMWHHVVLLEGLADGWFLMYGCVTTVIQMNIPGVRGYLQIADDTLLNTWNLINMPRDNILQRRGGEVRDTQKADVDWFWWKKQIGRCAALKTLAGLEKMSGLTPLQLLNLPPDWNDTSRASARSPTFSEILDKARLTCSPLPGSEAWPDPSPELARRFLLNYYHTHNMAGIIHTKQHDLLYMPHVLADDYVSISRYFMKHQAMIETAFSAIVYGLAYKGQIMRMQGDAIHGRYRDYIDAYFNESHLFLHPFKLNEARMRRKGDVMDLYCKRYLPKLFSALTKHD